MYPGSKCRGSNCLGSISHGFTCCAVNKDCGPLAGCLADATVCGADITHKFPLNMNDGKCISMFLLLLRM
ncbi:unnamed protein product [Didymodactylos carnosus]|uniref:Uncharacterized protein n=1 Tax=Didymodactylos carnosus TaxID=1234261 RepID=A0A8S2HSJ4_9BILA|nr:unnamed protein product [Didymodactylos carnosus]CAF3674183.1 unnamed protein product [Didymodactylos carnosus]